MKTSVILRRAAKLIEEGHYEFSCVAIKNSLSKNEKIDTVYDRQFTNTKAARAYAILLGRLPEWEDFDIETEGIVSTSDSQNHRVIALCLAAAIADDP
jgi:hypothetical protein